MGCKLVCCRRKPKPVPLSTRPPLAQLKLEKPQMSALEPLPPSVHEEYVNRLSKLLFAPADLSHDIALMGMEDKLNASGQKQPSGNSAARMRRLTQEMKDLSVNLPCTLSSSIFLRYDKKKPHFMKALITGPEDTPYECGVFEFDIFFPSAYPDVPPVVEIRTTGGGTARFNPNLYSNGKVCLSLLGTWNGTSACEKWSAKTSNLLQVLVSIQGLILVKYPFYNEPGRPQGLSQDHEDVRMNNNGGYHHIRMLALQWAVVDAMKRPSPVFADIIRTHFALVAPRVEALMRQWCSEPWLTPAQHTMVTEQHGTAVPAALQANLAAFRASVSAAPVTDAAPSSTGVTRRKGSWFPRPAGDAGATVASGTGLSGGSSGGAGGPSSDTTVEADAIAVSSGGTGGSAASVLVTPTKDTTKQPSSHSKHDASSAAASGSGGSTGSDGSEDDVNPDVLTVIDFKLEEPVLIGDSIGEIMFV